MQINLTKTILGAQNLDLVKCMHFWASEPLTWQQPCKTEKIICTQLPNEKVSKILHGEHKKYKKISIQEE